MYLLTVLLSIFWGKKMVFCRLKWGVPLWGSDQLYLEQESILRKRKANNLLLFTHAFKVWYLQSSILEEEKHPRRRKENSLNSLLMLYKVWQLQFHLYLHYHADSFCDCLSFNSWNKWQDDSDFYCLYQFPRLGLCHSRFSPPVTVSSGVLWKKGFANIILFVIFCLHVNFTQNTCRLLSLQWHLIITERTSGWRIKSLHV